MSVNDKWHYCHNSDVLVGSRAMRDRHLQLLGYIILQVNTEQYNNLIYSMFYFFRLKISYMLSSLFLYSREGPANIWYLT